MTTHRLKGVGPIWHSCLPPHLLGVHARSQVFFERIKITDIDNTEKMMKVVKALNIMMC